MFEHLNEKSKNALLLNKSICRCEIRLDEPISSSFISIKQFAVNSSSVFWSVAVV